MKSEKQVLRKKMPGRWDVEKNIVTFDSLTCKLMENGTAFVDEKAKWTFDGGCKLSISCRIMWCMFKCCVKKQERVGEIEEEGGRKRERGGGGGGAERDE